MYQEKPICSREISYIYHCGDVSGEVPPVLIPNTEVKLTSAENTLLATAREDRLLLHPLKERTAQMSGSFLLLLYKLSSRRPLTLSHGKKSQFITFQFKVTTIFAGCY